MQGKGRKAPLIAMAVAAVLAFALLLAGTILRMNVQNMDFFTALSSFLKDTFNPRTAG